MAEYLYQYHPMNAAKVRVSKGDLDEYVSSGTLAAGTYDLGVKCPKDARFIDSYVVIRKPSGKGAAINLSFGWAANGGTVLDVDGFTTATSIQSNVDDDTFHTGASSRVTGRFSGGNVTVTTSASMTQAELDSLDVTLHLIFSIADTELAE